MPKPKPVNSIQELDNMVSELNSFNQTYQEMLKDLKELIKASDECKGDIAKLRAMRRATLRGFYSLIESAFFGFNKMSPYEKYKKFDKFETKFEKTFLELGKTFGRVDEVNSYLNSQTSDILKFQLIRNELTHPKQYLNLPSLDLDDFNDLKDTIEAYEQFINQLMDGFFFEYREVTETEIPFMDYLKLKTNYKKD